MLEKLKLIFKTNTLFGRVLFVLISYVSFWLVFCFAMYWLINALGEAAGFPDFVMWIYFLALMPFVSFVIPNILHKVFWTNRFSLYIFHVVALLALVLFCGWTVLYFGLNSFGGF